MSDPRGNEFRDNLGRRAVVDGRLLEVHGATPGAELVASCSLEGELVDEDSGDGITRSLLGGEMTDADAHSLARVG